MRKTLPKIVAIMGQTGSGKTNLSIKIAKEFNGEIINADAKQIYKGFIIGTNAIKGEFKIINGEKIYVAEGVYHHLIQFQDPLEDFSVKIYKDLAISSIKKILKRKKLPIIVGGSGLYIRVVTDNLILPKVKPNKSLRKKLERKSTEELFKILKDIDPQTAEVIDKYNKVRLIRALEVVLTTGIPIIKLKTKGEKLFDVLKIAIKIEKEKLKKILYKRAKEMINQGLIEETKKLLKKYPKKINALRAIPYKLAIEFLDKKIKSKEELAKKIAKSDINYAKRQLTWLKKEKNIFWIENYSQAKELILKFLKDLL